MQISGILSRFGNLSFFLQVNSKNNYNQVRTCESNAYLIFNNRTTYTNKKNKYVFSYVMKKIK